jgi:hypothetical protein
MNGARQQPGCLCVFSPLVVPTTLSSIASKSTTWMILSAMPTVYRELRLAASQRCFGRAFRKSEAGVFLEMPFRPG